MKRRRIRVSQAAAVQIDQANDWWLANRPMAPHTLVEELERGFDLLRTLPGAGQRVAHPRHPKLRRLHLGRVRYFLYYLEADDENLDVLALWHSSRGSEPPV